MDSKEALKRIYYDAISSNEIEEDVEEIKKDYDLIKLDLDRLEKLEKELKQTKLNFRNSQIHSKNCYKKLKEKYTRLERAYKNNEVMTRDLNELINRNLDLKNELKRCQETISAWMENHKKLIIDNGKMKKAIKILKEYVAISKGRNEETGKWDIPVMYSLGLSKKISQEQSELLEKVFESVGGENAKD